MTVPADALVPLAMVMLVAVLLYLRTKYPLASKRQEMLVLVISATFYFLVCDRYLGRGSTGIHQVQAVTQPAQLGAH